MCGSCGLCVGLWQLFSWWTVGRFMVTTDDAYIAADMSALSAKIAGYIVEMPVANNRRVKAETFWPGSTMGLSHCP